MDVSLVRSLRGLAARIGASDAARWLPGELGDRALTGLQIATLERLASLALEAGEYYQAHDLCLRALDTAGTLPGWPRQTLVRLQAVALARTGAFQRAREILLSAIGAGVNGDSVAEADLYSVMARTFRDEAAVMPDPEQHAVLAQGMEWALKGFRLHPNAYRAGQTAQFARLVNGPENAVLQEALRYSAADAEDRGRRAAPDSQDAFWAAVDLAETALLQGRWDEALAGYRNALRLGRAFPGHCAATVKVCRFLLPRLECPDPAAEAFGQLWLSLPPVLVFSGHMTDEPDRPAPRFPPQAEGIAANAIAEAVRTLQPAEAFCCGAAGGDILFGEAIVAAACRLTLVLPFDLETTRTHSVISRGADWAARFDRLTEGARVKEAQHALAAGPCAISQQCDLANRLMLGMARLRAEVLSTRVKPVVLWDGVKPEQQVPGGTADFVNLCHKQGMEPLILTIPTLS